MQRRFLLALVCASGVLALTAAYAGETGLNKVDKNQLLRSQSAQVSTQADLDAILESIKEIRPAVERLQFVRDRIQRNPKLVESTDTASRVLGLEQSLIIEYVNAVPGLSGPERLRLLQRELEPVQQQREALKARLPEGGAR